MYSRSEFKTMKKPSLQDLECTSSFLEVSSLSASFGKDKHMH